MTRKGAPLAGGRRWRPLAALFLVALMWWSAAGPAAAHSDLVGSDPADGSVVTEPLRKISFRFSQAVSPFEDGFALVTSDGSALSIASIEQPDPAEVVVVPAQPVEVTVEVRWAIVSGDSHPVTGAIVVGVDVPVVSTTSTDAETASTTEPAAPTTEAVTTTIEAVEPAVGSGADAGSGPGPAGPVDVDEQIERLRDGSDAETGVQSSEAAAGVVRWAGYAATALVLGGTTLGILAGRQGLPVLRWTARWLWLGVVVLLLTAVLTVGAQLAELTGTAADLWSVGSWGEVFEGRLQTGVVLRSVGAALIAVALTLRDGRRVAVFAVGASAVLASYPVLGHVSEARWWVAAPASMAHVAAISVWAGGLGAVLVVGVRRERHQLVPVVHLFSRLAAVALVAAVVAGIALSVAQLDSVSELWSDEYGRRLAIKVALVGAVAGLGAFHRYRTVPQLEAGSGAATVGFTRLALLEMVGFAAVLAVTAWLVAGAG